MFSARVHDWLLGGLLGSLPDIRRDPIAFFLACARGQERIPRFRIGPRRYFVIMQPDDVKQVLVDGAADAYGKSTSAFRTLGQVFGRGMLNEEGERWLRIRRLAQPAFSRARIQALAPVVDRFTTEMVARWEPQVARGEPIAVVDEMMRLTLRIVMSVLLGWEEQEDVERLLGALAEIAREVARRVLYPLEPPLFVPTVANRRFNAAIAEVEDVIHRIIRGRRAALSRGEKRDDLLSMYLHAEAQDGGPLLGDHELRDEIFTITTAGYETSASGLSWMLHLLAQHPDEEAKLHAELDGVSSRVDHWDGAASPALDRVIKEALRLYPPVWLFERAVRRRQTVAGVELPPGATAVVSPLVTHRVPSVWPEPDRFLPERAPEISRFAYYPFGGGPRQCIGMQFAMTEMRVALAGLVERFHVEPAGETVVPDPLVSLRPTNLRLRFVPRGRLRTIETRP